MKRGQFFQQMMLKQLDIHMAKKQASLVAQMVKNLPAMQETPVRFLGQKDNLEKG